MLGLRNHVCKKCNRNGHKVVKVQEAGVGWEGGKLWPPNMFAGEPRKLNSTLQRNTFYSVGQNPCLTYWEIGGNVCPVNIGDVEAAGDIKRGGLTARKEPPLRLLR